MKKSFIVILALCTLTLCSCTSETQEISIADEPIAAESTYDTAETESAPVLSSELVSSELGEELDSAEEVEEEAPSITPETPIIAEDTPVAVDKPVEQEAGSTKAETTSLSEPVSVSASQPSAEPQEVPQTTTPTADQAQDEPTPTAPETSAPVISEPEVEATFDIDYWLSFAKSTAVSKGLNLESSAVDCWDNPITANPDCTYLERDITARLSRYAGDNDITDVWIWYECIGANSYLIYVGYA